MKIIKVINNNVVFSENEKGHEIIVTGRGLGFQKKPDDIIDESMVEKTFTLSNSNMNEKFLELLMEIPIEYVDIADQIIKSGKLFLRRRLNDGILLSLTDHIYYAVKRYKDNISVPNGLLWEIKNLYFEEYNVGKNALKIIEDAFSVRLPEDEAGFIALHIVNAQLDNDIPTIMSMTKIMNIILSIIKESFDIDFDEDSLSYHRFITHIKYFSQRLVTLTPYENEQDIDLFNIVKNKYRKAFTCAKKIKKRIENDYNYIFPKEELFYMTLHIERVVNIKARKDGK